MSLKKPLSLLTSIVLLIGLIVPFVNTSTAALLGAPSGEDFTLTTDNSEAGVNLTWAEGPVGTTKYKVYRRASFGSLSIASTSNPDAAIVVAGSDDVLASSYQLSASGEDYVVEKLTIINDLVGDFDSPVSTTAIENVDLQYTDSSGVQQTVTGTMAGGKVTFSGLDIFAEDGVATTVSVYADINTIVAVGEGLSGEKYRLGIQDTGNSSSTFDAIGQTSSNVINSPTITNSPTVNKFVVRKTMPTFARAAGSSTLINGENTLYGLTATADNAGAVGFGRLVFDVNANGLASSGPANVTDLKFYRGAILLNSSDVNIYCTDSLGNNATEIQTANGLDDCDGSSGNGIANGTYKIIVSFNTEETVSQGDSNTYYLKGTIAGANYSDILTISLADGDEAEELTGLSTATNENTGKVYVDGDATAGIFTVASTDFRQLLGTKQNIIWSDKSADAHTYPTVSAGDVTTNSGLYDYTNGYLLGIDELTSQVLSCDGAGAPDPTMTVALSGEVTDATYVKGNPEAPVLAFDLIGDSLDELTVSEVTVRFYGDSESDSNFSANGNTAANTLIASATVYNGVDLIAGPEVLTLVDNDSTTLGGFDADSTDYYKAVFSSMDFPVSAGATETLTVKVNLLNTPAQEYYLAADILPSTDIVVKNPSMDPVVPSPSSSLNNGDGAHDPEITILTNGTLAAVSEGSPDASVLVAGASDQLVSKYRFSAVAEDFEVTDLTIVNDMAGDFGDATASTAAVSQVTIKYTDDSAVEQTATGSLSGGVVTFSGLNFYVPTSQDVYLEIYADINTLVAVGEGLSGEKIRLGLQNYGNSSSTFEAVGQHSSEVANFDEANPTASISNSVNVNKFVVRKTMPTFARAAGSSTLINGENTFYGLTITADNAGAVGFGRLVFNLSSSGLDLTGTEDVTDLKFYRGAILLNSSDVNIYCTDSLGNNATEIQTANGLDDCDGSSGNGIANGTYKIIVSFNTEETVSQGDSNTYYLKGTVTGATANDTVSVSLSAGDESTEFTGLSTATNENTGKVYVDSNTAAGIFTVASADFRQLLGTGRNIIWSDKSADAHTYPTVSAGDVTTNSGSYDYTNGYLLGIDELSSSTLITFLEPSFYIVLKEGLKNLIPTVHADTEFIEIAEVTELTFRDLNGVLSTNYDYIIEALNDLDAVQGYSGIEAVQYITNAGTYDSPTDGQADLPTGETEIALDDSTNLDVSAGVSEESGGDIVVGGSTIPLNNFTSGDLAGEDLTTAKTVGDVEVTITKAVKIESGSNATDITVTNTDYLTATLTIPDETVIMGPNAWDGTIQPPKAGSSSGSAPSGFSVGGEVVEVGSPDGVLLFDKPVTVILNGSYNSVGYKPAGSSTWTQITNGCTGTYASPAAPTFPGECFINNGVDKTKVYTYHLTNYGNISPVVVANDDTPVVATGGGGGGGSSYNSRSTSNSSTSSSATNITVITGNQSYSRPVDIKDEYITVDEEAGTATAQVTEKGTLKLKPNSGSTIFLTIPENTMVTTNANWNGRIEPPLVKSSSLVSSDGEEITGSNDMLKRSEVELVVEVGSNESMTFSNDLLLEVPTDLPDGTVVNIYFSDDSNVWTSEGTAVVEDGYITFEIDHLSYFAFGDSGETSEITIVIEKESEESAEGAIETVYEMTAEFTDIANHWAKMYIDEIYSMGIASGKTDTEFAPNDYITRAELTKMAVNGFGLGSISDLSDNPFNDISTSDWYTPYVLAAKNSGVIEGYEGGVFSPNGYVNRAEALKILIEAAGFTDVDTSFYNNYESKDGWWYVAFEDILIDDWFGKYVGYVYLNGVVSGYEDGLFHPEWLITRAEVSKIISMLLDMM